MLNMLKDSYKNHNRKILRVERSKYLGDATIRTEYQIRIKDKLGPKF